MPVTDVLHLRYIFSTIDGSKQIPAAAAIIRPIQDGEEMDDENFVINNYNILKIAFYFPI